VRPMLQPILFGKVSPSKRCLLTLSGLQGDTLLLAILRTAETQDRPPGSGNHGPVVHDGVWIMVVLTSL